MRVTGGFGHAWSGLSGFPRVALIADLAVIVHNTRIGEGALVVLERNHFVFVQWPYLRGYRICESSLSLKEKMRQIIIEI